MIAHLELGDEPERPRRAATRSRPRDDENLVHEQQQKSPFTIVGAAASHRRRRGRGQLLLLGRGRRWTPRGVLRRFGREAGHGDGSDAPSSQGNKQTSEKRCGSGRRGKGPHSRRPLSSAARPSGERPRRELRLRPGPGSCPRPCRDVAMLAHGVAHVERAPAIQAGNLHRQVALTVAPPPTLNTRPGAISGCSAHGRGDDSSTYVKSRVWFSVAEQGERPPSASAAWRED